MTHPRNLKRGVAVAVALGLGAFALSGAASAALASASSPATLDGKISLVKRLIGHNTAANALFACQTDPTYTCYVPSAIRHAYGVDQLAAKGIDGTGSTITIIDFGPAPTIRHDLTNFSRTFGLPDTKLNVIAPFGLPKFDETSLDDIDDSIETSLDVEWAHAIAPKATIDLVLARSITTDSDVESIIDYVANAHLGDVVSQSFGGDECDTGFDSVIHSAYQKLTSHGTTVIASSGDTGVANLTCASTDDTYSYEKSVNTPAADPLVTGVGGTILNANGVTGAYGSEVAWNEPDYEVAGGGGFSKVYAEPAYQRSAQNSGARGVPDVAYHAGVDKGVLVAYSDAPDLFGTDAFLAVGGTSSGAPQWAGLVALATQVAGHRLGQINPTLYKLAASSKCDLYFHDITSGNNGVTEQDSAGDDQTFAGYSAHHGWDAATGLGSPKANTLVPALAKG